MRRINFSVLPAAVLSALLCIAGCPNDGADTYWVDEEMDTLTVTASVSDGGELSYQWYSNTRDRNSGGTLIAGETATSYKPPNNSIGRSFYYVVVTNTNSSAKVNKTAEVASDVVRVMVSDRNGAQMPDITEDPQDATYSGLPIILSVTAEVSDGGTLSYQWYSNTSESNENGEPVSGATNDTYEPDITVVGTFYYYVAVTNTNNNASGNKTATINSSVAIIIVPGVPPVITEQPASKTYAAGESPVPLSVTASGVGTLSYQWYSNTRNGISGGTAISGAAGSTYTPSINTSTAGSIYYYYVKVTNASGSADSDVAVLSVTGAMAASANITITIHNTVNTWPVNGGTSTATDRYQYIRGVGAADNIEFRAGNGSASPNNSNADIELLFNPDTGLGLNMLRIICYDDLEGFVTNRIKGTQGFPGGDNSDYFDHIKIVNKHGGFVYAVPWTVPAIYKATSATGTSGGTLLGNNGQYARLDRFPEIANHFIAYLDRLNAEGAPIFGFALQNEPNGDVGYEGCRYSGDNMLVMLRDHLGPKVRAARPGVPGVGPEGIMGYGGGKEQPKIWLAPGEHMGSANDGGGAKPTIDNVQGRAFIQFAGRHLYSNTTNTRYPDAHSKGIEVWETEITDAGDWLSPNYDRVSQWNYVWHIPNWIYLTFAQNDENAFFWWYAKRFYCLMGDGDRGTSNGVLQNRGYVMSHFSKFAANTTRLRVSATGSFVSNEGGTTASTANTSTALSSSGTDNNFNPTGWTHGASMTGGNNEPSTKIMAFESMDGNSISVIAYTPTRNDGSRGQNVGTLQINLPANFVAKSAYLMRSNSSAVCQYEAVTLSADGTKAQISLPKSNIVSVKFTK